MKKFTYIDPTGGGDDIEIKIPEWIEPREVMTFYGVTGERFEFEKED